MLVILALPALAVDLDLTLSPPPRWTPAGFTEGPEVSMTFHEVESRPIPVFLVPMSDGTQVRVSLTATAVTEEQWRLDARLEQIERHGKIERATLISSPRVTTLVDQQSEITQGMRGPVNGELRETSWGMEFVFTDG